MYVLLHVRCIVFVSLRIAALHKVSHVCVLCVYDACLLLLCIVSVLLLDRFYIIVKCVYCVCTCVYGFCMCLCLCVLCLNCCVYGSLICWCTFVCVRLLNVCCIDLCMCVYCYCTIC